MKRSFAVLMILLAGCASSGLPPLPETGAYSLKLLEIDGDRFLTVAKDGAPVEAQIIVAKHQVRAGWKRQDWMWYADQLFPQDEVSFDALRVLRGSNLVPQGLVSPKPSDVSFCDARDNGPFAKSQQRVVTAGATTGVDGAVVIDTSCDLHEGLSLEQKRAIHERPNPQRLPTRYVTEIDLDGDGKPEQRNIRIRNVSKATILDFVREDTDFSRQQQKQLAQALARM